jgi:hypothetical protein
MWWVISEVGFGIGFGFVVDFLGVELCLRYFA